MSAYADLQEKVNTQEKLYKTLEKLKGMAQTVPPKYQSRLSIELLSSLANFLLDNTNIQIIAELMDLQNIVENQLYQTRCNLIKRHKVEEDRLNSEHKMALEKAKCGGRLHAIPHLQSTQTTSINSLRARHQDEINKYDIEILKTIDKKVEEQQQTLELVGLPGFSVTTSPLEIKVQQYIITFILRLNKHNPILAKACSSSSRTYALLIWHLKQKINFIKRKEYVKFPHGCTEDGWVCGPYF